MREGEIREVSMHDGSVVILKNLDKDYNPTDRFEALHVLAEAEANNWLATGLIYIETDKPSLTEVYNLVETPLNRLEAADLRPSADMMDKVNALMF
jgi:2-oxoglutarate ferredoxin oxidoreductase subunit beta